MTPRVDGLLWTAPLFDDRKPEARPETYCMAMENGPCKCITEQGTRLKLPEDRCRDIAVNGVYNPYKRADVQRKDDRLPSTVSRSSQPLGVQSIVSEKSSATSGEHEKSGNRPL